MAFVDATRDLGVASACEIPAPCLYLGWTRVKSSAARGKQRIGFSTAAVSWRKKAQSVWSKRRSSPPKIRAQNLNRSSTSGKYDCCFVVCRPFSKSNMQPTRPLVETVLKKRAAGLVSVDAGRCQQSHDSVRSDQVHGALDEERVKVYPAAAE